MALTAVTSEVLDLGNYDQLSNTATFPTPVVDEFAPAETRARELSVTYDHSVRSPSSPEISGLTGIFSMTTRLKSHPLVTPGTFSGVFFSQMQNNAGTFVGSFFLQFSGNGVEVYCIDTPGSTIGNRIFRATNSLTSLVSGNWFELGVRINAINGGSQDIEMLVNGVDVASTVGYTGALAVSGTGVTAFDADGEINRTTLGNYDDGSSVQNGFVGIQGRTRYWNNITLSDTDFLDEYNDQQSQIPTATVTGKGLWRNTSLWKNA